MAERSPQRELQQIEQRYGFALPEDYRTMQERGWFNFDPDRDSNVAFDPTGCQYLFLHEMEWLSLEDIRGFEFPDYCLSGFVPFAHTGGGDHWCWYPNYSSGGSTPVVLCPHDCNCATFYAPHLRGALYRQILDYALAEEDQDLVRTHFKRWIAELGPMMPPPWVGTLITLQPHKGQPVLTEEAYQTIVQRDLAFPYLDQEIKWMED